MRNTIGAFARCGLSFNRLFCFLAAHIILNPPSYTLLPALRYQRIFNSTRSPMELLLYTARLRIPAVILGQIIVIRDAELRADAELDAVLAVVAGRQLLGLRQVLAAG